MIRWSVKHLAFLSISLAVALVLSYIESLIPLPIPLPGVKLGLANLITLLLIKDEKPYTVIALSLCRVGLSSLLFGSFLSFLYSLAGALISFIILMLLRNLCPGKITFIGLSVCAACAHNIGQTAVACLILNSLSMLAYLPLLLLCAVVAGCAVGICANIIYPRLKKK